MKTKEFGELEFVPCERHPQVEASTFQVNEFGAVVFLCFGCDVQNSAQVSALTGEQEDLLWYGR